MKLIMTVPQYAILQPSKTKVMLSKGLDPSHLRKSNVVEKDWIPLKQAAMEGKSNSIFSKYSKGSHMNAKFF